MPTTDTLNISIIEDDVSMRTMLEDFLKEKYPLAEIVSFANGEEALQKIASAHLVILDYNLDSLHRGGMNGLDVLKKLHETSPAIPVIFLSGQEKSEVAANTLKHGARDYIIKNELVFRRLETSLNNILGKAATRESTKKRAVTSALLIVAVSLLIAIFIWRSM